MASLKTHLKPLAKTARPILHASAPWPNARSWPRIVRVGLSEEEKIEHALALNLVRRHLSREQRQELVARLRQRGLSLRRIAELLGVALNTVQKDFQVYQNDTPERPSESNGADGKRYPARQRTEAERQELAAKLRQRGLSLRRIAELLGVTYETARQDLSIVKNLTIENPPVVQRADGKTYPARQRTEAEREELVEQAKALRSEGASYHEIARRRKRGLYSLASEASHRLRLCARQAAAFQEHANAPAIRRTFAIGLGGRGRAEDFDDQALQAATAVVACDDDALAYVRKAQRRLARALHQQPAADRL